VNSEGGLPAAPATHDPAATIAADVEGDLRVAVLRELVEDEDASANEVAANLGRRRGDVLRLVEAFRASGVVPRPTGSSRGAGTGTQATTRCPSCGAGIVVEVRRA